MALEVPSAPPHLFFVGGEGGKPPNETRFSRPTPLLHPLIWLLFNFSIFCQCVCDSHCHSSCGCFWQWSQQWQCLCSLRWLHSPRQSQRQESETGLVPLQADRVWAGAAVGR